MGNVLKTMRRFFRRAAKDESGTATIPFVIFLPFFLTLVMSSLEMGLLMVRHVMLERALDLAVRDLRLGIWVPASNVDLKRRICNYAGVLPNCMNAVLVELRPVSKITWQPLSSGPVCVDRTAVVQPVTEFVTGSSNDMMLVRACVKVDPMVPLTGIGFSLPKDNTGAYSLVSTTAFVNEPRPGS
jgi:Flp pilus assembly protein TadG